MMNALDKTVHEVRCLVRRMGTVDGHSELANWIRDVNWTLEAISRALDEINEQLQRQMNGER